MRTADGPPAAVALPVTAAERDLLAHLWPSPRHRFATGRAAAPPGWVEVAKFGVFGDVQRSRPLVPLARGPAAGAVRRGHAGMPEHAWLLRAATAAALRAGVLQPLLRRRVRILRRPGPAAPGAEGIDEHLAGVLGVPLVVAAPSFGPPRANWKAVVQLLAPDGRTLGWAKIGTNAVTRRLVANEAAFLRRASTLPLRRLQVARVLHAGEWHGAEVLVTSPLPTGGGNGPRGLPSLVPFLAELVTGFGATRAPLGAAAFWTEVRARADGLPAGPGRSLLAWALRALDARAARRTLAFGRWHGDWSPWNMQWRGDRLAVWDWERSRQPVPVGFDLLHHAFQTAPSRPAAAPLALLGVGPADQPLVLALYLVERVLRELEDATLLAAEGLPLPDGEPVLADALRAAVDQETRA
jgi:hypothetical protein